MKTVVLQELLERENMADEEKMYTVEVDHRGCSNCGYEAGYVVVGPDGVEESAVYHDREVVEEIAQRMNDAYSPGCKVAA